MSRRVILPLLACLAWPVASIAQTIAAEGEQASGASTASVHVAATQLRALGEIRNGLCCEVEGTFGTEPQRTLLCLVVGLSR